MALIVTDMLCAALEAELNNPNHALLFANKTYPRHIRASVLNASTRDLQRYLAQGGTLARGCPKLLVHDSLPKWARTRHSLTQISSILASEGVFRTLGALDEQFAKYCRSVGVRQEDVIKVVLGCLWFSSSKAPLGNVLEYLSYVYGGCLSTLRETCEQISDRYTLYPTHRDPVECRRIFDDTVLLLERRRYEAEEEKKKEEEEERENEVQQRKEARESRIPPPQLALPPPLLLPLKLTSSSSIDDFSSSSAVPRPNGPASFIRSAILPLLAGHNANAPPRTSKKQV